MMKIMQHLVRSPQGSKGFPRSVFNLMGGTAAILGIICGIVGIFVLANSLQNRDMCIKWARNEEVKENSEDGVLSLGQVFGFKSTEDIAGMDLETRCVAITAIGTASSLTYMFYGFIAFVTGLLGLGTGKTKITHRQFGLKTGYIVMNILLGVLFTPFMILVAVTTVVITPKLMPEKAMFYEDHILTGVVAAIVGVLTGVLSLVAASVSCCCAPVTEEGEMITPIKETKIAPDPASVPPIGPADVQLQTDQKALLITREAFSAQPVDVTC